MSNTADSQFFGHPRGLGTLFFTEMWERFSYYGMRALLVLYMTEQIVEGGMGMDEAKANAIYGLYTASVYLLALPGGWLADRLFGQRKAVWYGGIVIAAGHFSMAIPNDSTFFLGLVLIVLGTGLLKPNISSIVSGLYPEGGARQDAGFSIFYMGINIGAFISPVICGWLGETINWHMGFGAAGVGMVAGLIQYKMTEKYLGDVGSEPAYQPDRPEDMAILKRTKQLGIALLVLIIVLCGPPLLGMVDVEPVQLASFTGWVIGGLTVAFFVFMLIKPDITPDEKKRIVAIAIFFIFSAVFWSGFEQAGSSLNIFASNLTDRVIFGWEMPASWLQAVNPVMIIIFAPIYGSMWVWLSKRKMEPTSPLKFGMGLILLGLGFLVMVFAANIAAEGGKPLPTWLIMTYFLHTAGELALSPVGLSTVTKLAPAKYVSQMMGVWFMSVSFGNLMAGLVAGKFDSENVQQMPDLFMTITMVTVGAGVILAIFAKPVRKLMGHVH